MLTPQDDLIGHQLPTTFDQIDNSDPAWMERLWYTGHPSPEGDIIFDIGLGYHPNRNVMDAFAGVAVPGRQWNFRASRQLQPDPLTTRVGPIEIQVIEPLTFYPSFFYAWTTAQFGNRGLHIFFKERAPAKYESVQRHPPI